MRRKTAARRLLNGDDEGDSEHRRCEGAEHRATKPRIQLHPFEDQTEKPASCDGAPLRLITRSFEVENTAEQTTGDADITTQVLAHLQAYSRSELIAMVLSMQRETESLREQIKTLTACGKLAQTIEELVTKSDRWLNCCGINPTTSAGIENEGNSALTSVRAEEVRNDSRVEQQGSIQQGHDQKINEKKSRTDTPFYQEIIPAELLERCNTGTTAQKLTNELLRGLYDRDCLASHSISGIINSKRGQPKPALPAHEIQAILRAVQHYFPGKTDSEIKGYIRQKLQNEAKRLKKKPQLAEEPLHRP